MSDCRVKAAFYSAKRNIKNVADLLIGELVKVGEQQNLAKMIRHAHNRLLDRFLQLLAFERRFGE